MMSTTSGSQEYGVPGGETTAAGERQLDTPPKQELPAIRGH